MTKFKSQRLWQEMKFKMDLPKYRQLRGNGQHPANKFQVFLCRYGLNGYHYFPIFKSGLKADLLVKPCSALIYLEMSPTELDLKEAKDIGLRVWVLGPDEDVRWLEFAADVTQATVATLAPPRPRVGSTIFNDLEDQYRNPGMLGNPK